MSDDELLCESFGFETADSGKYSDSKILWHKQRTDESVYEALENLGWGYIVSCAITVLLFYNGHDVVREMPDPDLSPWGFFWEAIFISGSITIFFMLASFLRSFILRKVNQGRLLNHKVPVPLRGYRYIVSKIKRIISRFKWRKANG